MPHLQAPGLPSFCVSSPFLAAGLGSGERSDTLLLL